MYHTNATINFTNELLAFQNKHLNGAHFISDIQLPWLTQHYLIFYKLIQKLLDIASNSIIHFFVLKSDSYLPKKLVYFVSMKVL